MQSGGPSGSSRSSPATSPRPEQQQTPTASAQQQLGFRSQAQMFKRQSEHLQQAEKQKEQGNPSGNEQRGGDMRPPMTPQGVPGQQMSPVGGMIRPMQPMQGQVGMGSAGGNPLTPAQFQAIQAWAKERNLDLSNPANMSAISQLLPMWQSRMAMQKHNEASMAAHQQQASPSQGNSDTPGHGNVFSQSASLKPQQSLPPNSSVSGGEEAKIANLSNLQLQQQLSAHNRDVSNDRAVRSPMTAGNGGQSMQAPQSSGHVNKVPEQSNSKNVLANSEAMQMQHARQMQQLNQVASPTATPGGTGGSQAPAQGARPQTGFTKHQLKVLKAQILAFRRLKRGDRTLPPEVLELIMSGLPSDSQGQQVSGSSAVPNRDRPGVNVVDDHGKHMESGEKAPENPSLSKVPSLPKVEVSASEDKASSASGPGSGPMQVLKASPKEPLRIGPVSVPEHSNPTMVKSEQESERGIQRTPGRSDFSAERGKSLPAESGSADAEQAKRAGSTSSAPAPRDVPRKYHGPLFDFPAFTRRHDSMGSANYNSNLSLGYDVKDLLAQEGTLVLGKKREDNLKKISGLLAINLERKRIRPDLVLRLQIEEKKLKLLEHQARLRDEVEQEQQEIMAMPDRIYRKFVRQCERQRVELARQVQQMQKASREKQLKSIFQWRKKLLEAHWAIRDARITRNRGVAKYHERMLREFSKKKDDDRNKRMEALKNNDVERYRQILLEQQTSVPGDAAQRYNVLSSFLTQTEEYLYKLGGKISAAKNQQQVEEAANAAATVARAQGLSEEEVKAAAQCAGQEVMIRNTFSEMNAPRDSISDNKYYNLAHAVSERVTKQPSLLRAGTLRDYQLVGLQWMLSLYNNKLNGILADEMGLGKTVQSELLNWLPSASCIFYVGAKDQRQKLFSQEVLAMKFNILVTTYEFIMFDRSKLSRIDWKYIIIDEAQRMKDRDSVLARDLDRYRCQRRLLLTGTPLQNDLKELWSLLNLLLPEVFDSSKAFQDWFSKPFQRDGPTHSEEEDDWLETEKKVIIIHRLHQILEPFMLRRRVEDVEGSLPRKDSIVLRCRMSAIQGAIYDWIKSTGTIRVDPEDEKTRAQRNPMYQVKTHKNLNNKCMELRKVCNHPLLSYPFLNCGKDFMVRSCGKLWNLDRILIKLHKAGHRVLLFSTMTKLLDIMEDYLQWRQLVYRRIDGTTSLEDRESAIVDFNRPNSDCFIFLLSIRAAGRGLNLQSADTVVIYDPDPNPQNEEQAVARAHRIGQTREVKVIYLEAVVDNISSYQKEDELRNGGSGDFEDDLAGKDRYMGSIESLIRNNIQQYKIDMADEVINAGRFDQRTTHEERRMTLETLLHDEERYQETLHDVPSLQEVNRMIARTEEEVELFDQMDEDFDWTGDMMKHNQVPKWLRASSTEVDGTNDTPEKRRGRPKSSGKYSIYREIDDDDLEESDEDSEQRNISSLPEEGEIGESEDEEDNDDSVPDNKDESEEEEPIDDDGYDLPGNDASPRTAASLPIWLTPRHDGRQQLSPVLWSGTYVLSGSDVFKRQSEHLQQAEKQKEQGNPSGNEQRGGDMRPPMTPQGVPGQQMSPVGGMIRPMQPMQGQVGMGSAGGNPLTPAQFQAIQAWAKERNLDLSNPANMSAISQLLPMWQSRMAMQKQNEAITVPSLKPRQSLPPNSSVSGGEEAKMANLSNLQLQQQLSAHNRDVSNDRAVRSPMTAGNGGQSMQAPQSSGHVNKVPEQSNSKNVLANSEAMQMQHARQMQQLNQVASPTATPGGTGGSQAPAQGARPQTGFTKHQLKVLKAQILAFRRLKRGDRTLPPEVLELIMSGLPSDSQGQQVSGSSAVPNRDRPGVNVVDDHGKHMESGEKAPENPSLSKVPSLPKKSRLHRRSPLELVQFQYQNIATPPWLNLNRNQNVASREHLEEVISVLREGNLCQQKVVQRMRSRLKGLGLQAVPQLQGMFQENIMDRYFDFPAFTRRHDSMGSANYNSNLSLGYDVKDLLAQEGTLVLGKKREDNLKKISGLLAINLERKRIRPDLVLRLQIEEKKLKLLRASGSSKG
ncbi:hypothetical protein PR202_ga06236 [Eleusine coracana subsp. coracana]|uniref:ATP-dependent helicase BRM n=1 Tax=Eleusine coracana subsp. coracana TaxID=191504 RepID=A0AAV5BUA3_ELECO|nr:hypothetical protein PR202_ga06236 [Eleusine coracana subsp. coracana]